jgi:AcrR family transcriptional regulator
MDELSENRFDRRKKRTRTALMQAAGELLIEKGYDALTVHEIADRADVGRATFYMHFTDKEDIVWQMLYEHSQMVTQITNETLANEPFPRKEYLSWRMFFERAQTTKAVTNAIFGGKGGWQLYRRLVQYVAELHQENLSAGTYSAGLNLPPEVMAQFAGGALMQVVGWWLSVPNEYTAEQMADLFFHMIYHVPPSDEVKYGKQD